MPPPGPGVEGLQGFRVWSGPSGQNLAPTSLSLVESNGQGPGLGPPPAGALSAPEKHRPKRAKALKFEGFL